MNFSKQNWVDSIDNFVEESFGRENTFICN